MVRKVAIFATCGSVAVLVALIVLISNPPEDSMFSDEPPAMLLVADSGEYEAGIGSFCGQIGPFTGKCADRTLEGSIPDETAVIPRGSQFEVRMVNYQNPELLVVTVRDANLEVTSLELVRVSQAEFVANIPEGNYVVDFFAKWEDASMRDSSYHYRINVV